MLTRQRLTIWALLCLSACFLASCGCDDDDDNDSGDDVADDDAADDDAADDDAADDDAADDDAADDDDDDDATDDDDDDDDDDWNELFAVDFESYNLGDLPAPWDVTEHGNSYVEVIDDPTAKPGKVMNMAGATGDGNGAIAAYPVTHTGTQLAFVYDVSVPPTAWSWVTFNYGEHRAAMIRFNPDWGEVQFDYVDNFLSCGAYNTGAEQWYTVRVDIDLNTQTADLTVNGVLTSCVDAPLHPEMTFTAIDHVDFADWEAANEGGADYYDNFYGYEAD